MSSNKKLMGREAASSADDQTGVVLTVKPHAFGGAVLSPKHARELNPSLCLNIVTALSSEFSRKAVVPYTLWITEAWRVLGWAEPSAALFWEMATMYHTLYLAARIESGDVIPPILSCGSHSSMGSVTPIEQHGRINKQKYTTTAKDLPVWLIGTFLLLHCEDSTYAFEESSDGRAGSSEHALWQQRHIPTRDRSYAGQIDHYTRFLLRHMRKILLLLAVPHNDEAVRACMHLASLSPVTSSYVSDSKMIEKIHQEEHGNVGATIRLSVEDIEKLHFVLQPLSGGGVDESPLEIGKYMWDMTYYGTPMPNGASIPLGEVERLIRQQLTMSYQKRLRPETALAKLSLKETQAEPSSTKPGYQKELTYTNLRGTTILLKHESTETQHLHDLVISDCSDAHFYLLQPFEHVTISFCTGCTIVVGAVAGSLYVLDCERTLLTSACRRLIVCNSSEVLSHVFTPSPPLLVGDNRSCQLAPYNSYYDGLRDDLLATGLAAAILQDGPPSPGSPSGTSWPLQCASNKWKQPVELSKMEIPHVDEIAGTSTDDAAMQTPILLPAVDFNILFVPLSGEARVRKEMDESNVGGTTQGSQYCQLLAQVLQLSPFHLPIEYERQALSKAERMRSLQDLIKTLPEEQQARLEDELNRGFRDWLVTSGNLRQVLDLVHLERNGGI